MESFGVDVNTGPLSSFGAVIEKEETIQYLNQTPNACCHITSCKKSDIELCVKQCILQQLLSCTFALTRCEQPVVVRLLVVIIILLLQLIIITIISTTTTIVLFNNNILLLKLLLLALFDVECLV